MKSLAYAAAAAVALGVLIVPSAAASETHYANCQEVRDAGKDPLHKGDPGYRAGLDRDNDGLACEPGETGDSPAGATTTGTAKVSAPKSVDPCSVMSKQAAGKLRPMVEPLLTGEQKDLLKALPDEALVAAIRLKAKCSGNPPQLSADELDRRLCLVATVDGLRSLGSRIGAADQAKAKATDGNVTAIRVRLGCDKATAPTSTSSTSTTTKKPTSPTSDNPRGRTPVGKGGGYSQVGDRDVPVGSIATGG